MRAIGRLVWEDDFNGPAGSPPDPACWRHEIGAGGWGNGELQRYTDEPANAYQDGRGNLCIVGRKDSAGAFSSARLVSKGLVQFQYGRLEARVKLPGGQGLWSALWLLGADIESRPWPACGEIDVMEHIGAEDRLVFGTVHCPGHCGRDGISGDHIAAARLSEDFHSFAVDWSAEAIVWSIDGHDYFTVTPAQLSAAWVFDHPFYILVNLAIGGWLGGAVGEATRFPATLQIDHVRIFAAD